VQDEIAAAISGALQTEIIGPQTQQATETSVEAYDLYLLARQKLYDRNKAEMEEGLTLLDQALVIDNEYAPALAQKALALILLSDGIGSYGDIPEAEAAVAARELVDKALMLDDRLAEAHAISALVMESEKSEDWDEMIDIFEYALQLNPNLDNARLWLARVYGFAGRNTEARQLSESIIERDPLFGAAFNNLTGDYLRTNDLDLANALVGRYERAAGETADVHQAWGDIAFAKGDIATAVRRYKRVFDENPTNTINRASYSFALRIIGEYEESVQVGRANQKIGSLGILGRHNEALELLDTLNPNSEFDFDFGSAISYFVNARRYDEAVAYAEQHFDDLDTLTKHFASPAGQNAGYMAPLAFSYLQVNRTDEFQQLTKAMAEAIELARADGTDNFNFWLYETWLAAMTGSDDDVLGHAQKIVNNGGVGVRLFAAPVFDRMKDNVEFQNLRALVLKRANDERAKLGLDSYLSPINSN
jgi:tetratricopeptide (TPR) repeat protein